MKNLNSILALCFVIIVVILGGVFAFHMYTQSQAASKEAIQKKMYQLPSYPAGAKAGETLPSDVLVGRPVAPESPGALMQELEQTQDDGGTQDIEMLKSEAAAL